MNKLSIVVIAVLSLAVFGCKKGGDCGKAITNSMEVSKADMAKMPGVDDKMMEKMKDLGLQHCKDDKWPEDVVKCMSDAKTEAEAQGCYLKMTADQKEKMSKGMMEIMATMPPHTGGVKIPKPAGDDSTVGAGAPATGDTGGSAAAPK